jgi:hypothetical protein
VKPSGTGIAVSFLIVSRSGGSLTAQAPIKTIAVTDAIRRLPRRGKRIAEAIVITPSINVRG